MKIDFHLDKNSSCPWYIIIYHAPIVITNAAQTQKTSTSLSNTLNKKLFVVSHAHSHIKAVEPGVISPTGIVKLEFVISPAAKIFSPKELTNKKLSTNNIHVIILFTLLLVTK